MGRILLLILLLSSFSSYAVDLKVSQHIVSNRMIVCQDSCFECKKLEDSIRTTVFDNLDLSSEYHKKYWFYPWSMAEEYNVDTFISLNRDSMKYKKFLASAPYRYEYEEVIDSLICDEINLNHIETFCYSYYSKQIYCYKSTSGDTMALVCCYLRLKDPIYYDEVMQIFSDSFPFGFYAVINLSKKKMKQFIGG